MNNADFIRSQIAEVEKSILARQQSESTFLGGTEKSWAYAAAIAGVKPMSKARRIDAANRESRILKKLRQKLDMLNTVLSAL